MKRPHRRIHFLIWLGLAPITAIAAFAFWTLRPDALYSDLPPGIETISDERETR